MTLSRLFARPSLMAVALAIAVGVSASPALAQRANSKPPANAGPTVSKELVGPLNEGRTAVLAKDYATAKVKLEAAAALAKTPNDKLQVEKLRVPMAQDSKDWANLVVYLQNAIDTNLLTPEETKSFKYGFVMAYAQMGDNAKAITALRGYVDQYGGTPEQLAAIGNDLVRANDPAGVGYVEKAVAAAKAAGQKPSEANYRLLLKGYETTNKDKYFETLDTLIAEYPNPQFWGQYITLAQKEPGFQAAGKDVRIDVYRAAVAAGVKLTPDMISAYADETVNKGFPGEAVAALEPLSAELGASAKATLANATKLAKDDKAGLAKEEKDALAKGSADRIAALGEAFYTYGEYAKAAELIQAALTKGIAEPGKQDIARLHLGMAQYKGGQKDAALATWAQVKSDNGTAVLARMWTQIAKTKG
jgi:tetratricopeptide (TPR) repeat protein